MTYLLIGINDMVVELFRELESRLSIPGNPGDSILISIGPKYTVPGTPELLIFVGLN
jgi:hypothetical protein